MTRRATSAGPLTEERSGLGYALLATVFFATSGPVVRLAGAAGPVSPTAVAFWRVLLGAAFVGLIGWSRGTPPRVSLAHLPAMFGYGAVLGLHFYLYIGSLFATSLDHALVLVNTAPVWAALLSWLVLGEGLPWNKLPGVFLVLAATAWLVGFDPATPSGHLRGDLMGLGAAITYAVYAVAGRRDRDRYPLLTYAFWVYLGAALSLALIAPRAVFWTPVPAASWLPIVLLALLPTTFGHTLFNAAIRRIHVATANLIGTQEVSGGILLGWLLLSEIPTRTALLAWPLVLAGIAWVILWPPRKRTSEIVDKFAPPPSTSAG